MLGQVCTVNLIVRKLETAVMEITPHVITMESETVLTQYLITNWTLAYNNASNVDSGIQMTIVLKCRILNAILTVYLPTVLVLIIVMLPTFSRPSSLSKFIFLVSNIMDKQFQGRCHCEPHSFVGLDYPVHKRIKQPSTDGLYQDG